MGHKRTTADSHYGSNLPSPESAQRHDSHTFGGLQAPSSKSLNRNSGGQALKNQPEAESLIAGIPEGELEAEFFGQWPARFGSRQLHKFLVDKLGDAATPRDDLEEVPRLERLKSCSLALGRLVAADLLRRDPVLSLLKFATRSNGLLGIRAGEAVERSFGWGLESPIQHEELSVMLEMWRQGLPLEEPDAQLREISLEGGRLPKVVDEAEEVLLADAPRSIFQRGSLLVRVSGLESGAGQTTAPSIYPVEVPYLVERLTKVALWTKPDVRTGTTRVVDCPDRVARTYLSRRGSWRLPVLKSLVEAPTLRADGSVISKPGFDEQSGVYFHAGGTTFRSVPANPTLENAQNCVRDIAFLLRGFPWVEDSDRSAALAAMLTALVRPSLRTAPLFAFRAPVMGSGKSLLADCVALMATGRPAPVLTQGRDEEEDRKRILSILLDGDSIACIDNIERPLRGAALSSVLTQESYKDRLLGRSETVTVPTAVTWMATGNNLVLHGDITTRVVPCDLDPKCERPEEREFNFDIRQHILENRGTLVPAALTILRAYKLAGSPAQNIPVFGRFEDWSDSVRSALVWCGEADPCLGRARIEETDPVRSDIKAVFDCWSERFGSEVVTAAELVKASGEESDVGQRMKEALLGVAAGKERSINSRRLGKWLAQVANRIEDGQFVQKRGTYNRATQWQLVSN